MRAALAVLLLASGPVLAVCKGTDCVITNDNILLWESTITYEAQIVLPKKVKTGECSPGSIAFEDDKYWGCKLVPQYFEIPMVEPKKVK